MPAPARTLTSLSAVTTGTGTALECGPEPHYITVYIHSTGTISAGAIQVEESHDGGYSSTWAAVGSPVTVPTSGNQVAVARVEGIYNAIRCRVSTTVTGGGSATAVIIATPVR